MGKNQRIPINQPYFIRGYICFSQGFKVTQTIISIILQFRFKLILILSILAAILPTQVFSDVVYGNVKGLSAGNFTLTIYKDNRALTAIAANKTAKNQYEYQINLAPGEYIIEHNKIRRKLVNYPGTNKVDINFN